MMSDALGVSVVANVVRRCVLSACMSLSSLGLCLLWGLAIEGSPGSWWLELRRVARLFRAWMCEGVMFLNLLCSV